MTEFELPLVSVITPVYNGEDFLVECVESVLSQTYRNYEYLIVNNCSKDRTLEIALSYAKKDSRIHVHDNKTFLAVIANHNHAFRLISASAKYCKVVSADDFIFPDCLSKMVELAESHPSVGIVGSYQQSGGLVRWQGFRYPTGVLSGVEICREIFLSGRKDFGFGSPTSILYRADLVRTASEFYPNPSPHSDTSAIFRDLQHCDFGFVYQVLSCERTHSETQTSKSQQLNRYASAYLDDVLQYGPAYLTQEEFGQVVTDLLRDYRRFLAVNYFLASQGTEFWSYHKDRLAELGYPLKRFQLTQAAIGVILREVLNPEQAIRKIAKYLVRRSIGNPRAVVANIAPVDVAAARLSAGSRQPTKK
jgi:glycosyltransferase involved in cell wall biosynthesis